MVLLPPTGPEHHQASSEPRYYSVAATTDKAQGTITPPTLALRRHIFDEVLEDILGLSKESKSESHIWPYNMQTLNEILRFKIEQERTKQELLRQETTQASLQLLQLAQSLNIPSHLVPMLFVQDTDNNTHIRQSIATLESKPEDEVRRHLQEKFNKVELGNLINPELPKLPKLVAILPRQNLPAPLHSSTTTSKLPPLRKRRAVLDLLDRGQWSMTQAETPVTQTASPQAQPQIYPVYYDASGRPQFAKLGLPYSQKYTPVIMGQPPYMPMHYPYFVTLPLANPQFVPVLSQAPAPAQGLLNQKRPVPTHQFQRDETNVFRPAEIPEEGQPFKRQKLKLAINFMITTPKNPPQKKYNKDRQ